MESKYVVTMGEVKNVVVNIAVDPRVSTIISLVIISMPPLYAMLLGWEWINATGELINFRMATITFPHNRYLITLTREGRYKEQIQAGEE